MCFKSSKSNYNPCVHEVRYRVREWGEEWLPQRRSNSIDRHIRVGVQVKHEYMETESEDGHTGGNMSGIAKIKAYLRACMKI